MAQPVFAQGDAKNAVIGLVYLEMNASAGLYSRIVKWPQASRTSESMLLRLDGEEVVYLSSFALSSWGTGAGCAPGIEGFRICGRFGASEQDSDHRARQGLPWQRSCRCIGCH